MMNQGWIKLHRKLLDSSVMSKSAYFHLWVTLLLLANHKKTTFIFNDKEQTLLPGQVLTGRKKLAKITGINQHKVDRILKFLKSAQQIEQHKTSKFRIISIKNWEKYQAVDEPERQSAQQVSDNCADSAQRASTYKNDNNEKNEKNYQGDFSDRYSQKQIVERALKKLKDEGVF